MPLPRYDINLDRPPSERWSSLRPQRHAMRELFRQYVKDAGGLRPIRDELSAYYDAFVPDAYADELEAIAHLSGVPTLEALLCNVYYDLFKQLLACTAFAIDTADGPIHARNLDWWTEAGALGRHSVHYRLGRGPARTPVEFISWPGMLGTFSGVAIGRCTVTLNAVLSDEAPQLALPVPWLIREVLLSAKDYDEAVSRLAKTPLACDCLLLVTGCEPGQMCVIERTPTRHMIRHAEDSVVAVTNDYRALDPGSERRLAELTKTACHRFELAAGRARAHGPSDVEGCMAILNHPAVKQGITVQQMVLSARRGVLFARGV